MELRTFNYNGKGVTTFYDKDKNPWFVASDICKILGHTNVTQRIKDHCDEKGVRKSDILTGGGVQSKIIIDEPNLYRLIFRSKIKSAKEFQNWVVVEVLPSIRKTGKYEIGQQLKQISTSKRNELTDMWKEHGCTEPHHYINLTREEYKLLFDDAKKKKTEMTREEILTLSALESMEALALFHGNQKGYYKCRDSLKNTAKQIPTVSKKEITN